MLYFVFLKSVLRVGGHWCFWRCRCCIKTCTASHVTRRNSANNLKKMLLLSFWWKLIVLTQWPVWGEWSLGSHLPCAVNWSAGGKGAGRNAAGRWRPPWNVFKAHWWLFPISLWEASNTPHQTAIFYPKNTGKMNRRFHFFHQKLASIWISLKTHNLAFYTFLGDCRALGRVV